MKRFGGDKRRERSVKELTGRIGRVWKVGRRKEGRNPGACETGREEEKKGKERKSWEHTTIGGVSAALKRRDRPIDRSVGRSRQVHTLAAVGCLTDQYPPTTRNSRTGTQRLSDRLLLHTLLVGPSRPGRAAFSAAGRAEVFGSAKRECCRGWGAGQARATDWTEVGVIRTLLRLLSFCCLFTLSFSRPKSSRLLAIPTFYVLRSPPPPSPYYNLLLPTLFSWF
jgi:hypothetical protein